MKEEFVKPWLDALKIVENREIEIDDTTIDKLIEDLINLKNLEIPQGVEVQFDLRKDDCYRKYLNVSWRREMTDKEKEDYDRGHSESRDWKYLLYLELKQQFEGEK
jgi:hypothetical protein